MNEKLLGCGESRQKKREAIKTERRGLDDIHGGAAYVRDGLDDLTAERLPEGRQSVLDGVADIRAGARACVTGSRELRCLLCCKDIEDIKEGLADIAEGLRDICKGLEEVCCGHKEAGLRRIRRGVEDVEDGERFIESGLAGL